MAEGAADKAGRMAEALELNILSVVAEAMRAAAKSADYADARAREAADLAKMKRLAERGAAFLEKLARKGVEAGANGADEWAAPAFAAKGLTQPLVAEDPGLSGIVSGIASRVVDMTGEMCRTSVMRIVTPSGQERRIDEGYRELVDMAIRGVRSDPKGYAHTIEQAVRKLSRGGLRVRYESGNSRELYAAVSMNVRDGFRRVHQDVRNEQAARFGADGVEVSAHGLCAPDHLPYQGKQFTKKEFQEIQASLKRPIGEGLNCQHSVWGILIGVSAPAWTAEQLEDLRQRSEGPSGVKNKAGRELTRYEFSQWQRARETEVRKLKAEARLLEKAGADGEKARARAEELTADYLEKSKTAKATTRPERLNVYDWKL